jgi:broad specificity phosphatase PhoE
MLELVLARHGQSHGNLDRSLGPDTDLTDLGRAQATRLGHWLAAPEQGYAFTAFYCSTLRRARQTAEIVNAHFGLDITFDHDLREAETHYELPPRADPLGPDPSPPFSPEYEALRTRVTRATARILAENPEGQVLVVAHGGALGTMLRSMLGVHAMLLRTELTAVHCLRLEDGVWNLQYVNRQEHLIGL